MQSQSPNTASLTYLAQPIFRALDRVNAQPESSANRPSGADSAPVRRSLRSRVFSSAAAMVLVAFALRLAVMTFLYNEQLDPYRDHWRFAYETGRLARSIAEGRGFADPLYEPTGVSAFLTPVYPYLVAGVFKVFGIYSTASAMVLLIFQCLVSALNCLPVVYLARKLFSERVALWSGWAWAFFPYAIYFPAERIWSTWIATLLLTILFLLAFELENKSSAVAWIGYGLLWGLTGLIDPISLAALPFLGVWTIVRRHQLGRRWFALNVIAAIAFFAVITPWFVRNYETFHRFIFFRDTMGMEIHLGNNGDSFHWRPRMAGPWHNEQEWQDFQRLGELAYMDREKQRGLDYIRAHPAWFAWMTVRRFTYIWTGFWSFDKRYLEEEPLDPPNVFFCTVLTILAVMGWWRLWKNQRQLAILFGLVLLLFPSIYYVTHVEVYYRRQIDPYLVILAVYGLVNRFGTKSATNSGSQLAAEASSTQRTLA